MVNVNKSLRYKRHKQKHNIQFKNFLKTQGWYKDVT